MRISTRTAAPGWLVGLVAAASVASGQGAGTSASHVGTPHGGTPDTAVAGAAMPPRIALPAPRDEGDFLWSIGLSVATLPRMVVEEEVNQSPMIDARAAYGLPLNLTATAHLTTNLYVATHLALGVRYGLTFGRFSGGIGYEAAYWFGQFNLSGFDNAVHGFFHYPYVSLGFDAGDVSITARGELQYLTQYRQFAGDIDVDDNRDRLAGVALGVYIEQPLWKNNHVMLGAKVSSADFFYQAWMAFNIFRRYQVYPELFFAFLIR